MRKQEGSAVLSVIIGVILVGVLLGSVYVLYQRSRDVTSNTPLFTSNDGDDRVGVDGQSKTDQPAEEGTDETTPDEATNDTSNDTATSSDENSGNAVDDGDQVAVNSTTPDELAPTGPETSILAAVAIAAFVYSGYRYVLSVRQISSL